MTIEQEAQQWLQDRLGFGPGEGRVTSTMADAGMFAAFHSYMISKPLSEEAETGQVGGGDPAVTPSLPSGVPSPETAGPLRALQAAIAPALEGPWHPFPGEHPPHMERIIFLLKGKIPIIGAYLRPFGTFFNEEQHEYERDLVTHWMKFPELP